MTADLSYSDTAGRTGTLSDGWRLDRLRAETGGLVVIAYGQPAQQGSKTRGIHGGVYESSAKTLKPWREAVKWAALVAVSLFAWDMPTRPQPVSVEIVTCRKRPPAHFGTGRNEGVLKDWAAVALPATAPDGDKLERAILDALKWGGAYEDDAQVVDGQWRKRYATPGQTSPWILERPGAVIVVRRIS